MGDGEVHTALKDEIARVVLLASDAGKATVREFTFLSGAQGIPVLRMGSKEEVGRALGGAPRAVVAITESGLARLLTREAKEAQAKEVRAKKSTRNANEAEEGKQANEAQHSVPGGEPHSGSAEDTGIRTGQGNGPGQPTAHRPSPKARNYRPQSHVHPGAGVGGEGAERDSRRPHERPASPPKTAGTAADQPAPAPRRRSAAEPLRRAGSRPPRAPESLSGSGASHRGRSDAVPGAHGAPARIAGSSGSTPAVRVRSRTASDLVGVGPARRAAGSASPSTRGAAARAGRDTSPDRRRQGSGAGRGTGTETFRDGTNRREADSRTSGAGRNGRDAGSRRDGDRNPGTTGFHGERRDRDEGRDRREPDPREKRGPERARFTGDRRAPQPRGEDAEANGFVHRRGAENGFVRGRHTEAGAAGGSSAPGRGVGSAPREQRGTTARPRGGNLPDRGDSRSIGSVSRGVGPVSGARNSRSGDQRGGRATPEPRGVGPVSRTERDHPGHTPRGGEHGRVGSVSGGRVGSVPRDRGGQRPGGSPDGNGHGSGRAPGERAGQARGENPGGGRRTSGSQPIRSSDRPERPSRGPKQGGAPQGRRPGIRPEPRPHRGA